MHNSKWFTSLLTAVLIMFILLIIVTMTHLGYEIAGIGGVLVAMTLVLWGLIYIITLLTE